MTHTPQVPHGLFLVSDAAVDGVTCDIMWQGSALNIALNSVEILSTRVNEANIPVLTGAGPAPRCHP